MLSENKCSHPDKRKGLWETTAFWRRSIKAFATLEASASWRLWTVLNNSDHWVQDKKVLPQLNSHKLFELRS